MDAEYVIVGGGIVGLSIAYGLLKHGKTICVFDEGDVAYRASHGNFGLVWVQGKGLSYPEYAKWSQRSAAHFPAFVNELEERSGQCVSLVQDGGYSIYLNEQDMERDTKKYETLKRQLEGVYPFEVMGHTALKREEPNIGPTVAGAIYSPEDGHLNPFGLIMALSFGIRSLKGTIKKQARVRSITPGANDFFVEAENRITCRAQKIVLAAGLGARELGRQLGFEVPIRPQQGQLLITEKLPKLMNRPNVEIRQVNEGGVQIGATKAEVGMEDREDIPTIAALARHAVEMFPILARAKLLRSWAALRIVSPDGFPIYAQSTDHPGAFLITCHSGITLAAAHSEHLTRWIAGESDAPDLTAFNMDRFDVSAN